MGQYVLSSHESGTRVAPFCVGNDGALPHVYVSYKHPARWPPLDNGGPIPSRVQFHNILFPTPYTFRGQILWQEDYGMRWQGMILWEYKMKLDDAFVFLGTSALSLFCFEFITIDPRVLFSFVF